jgi:hypothetical protein
MLQHGAVGQLQSRELRVSGLGAELIARALAEEGNWVAVARDDLLVLDPRLSERLLGAATRVHLGASVVAMANE